jgi:hypothetical protein
MSSVQRRLLGCNAQNFSLLMTYSLSRGQRLESDACADET